MMACENMNKALITDLEAFILDIKGAFPKYNFHLEKQGAGWARIFVQIMQGDGIPCSLGRINFEPAPNGGYTIYGIKHYKPHDYPYHPDDAFFYQFERWTRTGEVMAYEHLIPVAKQMAEDKVKRILAQRLTMPPKKRKKPHANWQHIFYSLVMELMLSDEREGRWDFMPTESKHSTSEYNKEARNGNS